MKPAAPLEPAAATQASRPKIKPKTNNETLLERLEKAKRKPEEPGAPKPKEPNYEIDPSAPTNNLEIEVVKLPGQLGDSTKGGGRHKPGGGV